MAQGEILRGALRRGCISIFQTIRGIRAGTGHGGARSGASVLPDSRHQTRPLNKAGKPYVLYRESKVKGEDIIGSGSVSVCVVPHRCGATSSKRMFRPRLLWHEVCVRRPIPRQSVGAVEKWACSPVRGTCCMTLIYCRE